MNRKMTSAAIGASVLGGALVGASFVGSAGAYGGLEDEAPEGTDVETTELETSTLDDGDTGNVLTQDTDDGATPDADADGEAREGRRGHRGGGCHLEEIAAAIGIEEDALRAELDAGQSIADVAEANGIDAAVIVDLLVDSAEERIAEKVEEGRITEEEAAEKLANVEERAEDRVERVRGEDADDDADA